jgi:hypothetical protein
MKRPGIYHPLAGTRMWQRKRPPSQVTVLVGARGLEPPNLTDVNRAL